MSSDNYRGLARASLFLLVIGLLLGTGLPNALHLLLSWGLSGLLLFAVLKGTADDDDRVECKARRKWGIGLVLAPTILLVLHVVLADAANAWAGLVPIEAPRFWEGCSPSYHHVSGCFERPDANRLESFIQGLRRNIPIPILGGDGGATNPLKLGVWAGAAVLTPGLFGVILLLFSRFALPSSSSKPLSLTLRTDNKEKANEPR
jgi:hypothetical protein